MECIYCHYPKSYVVTIDHDEKNKQSIRRRECAKCGMRFTTTEHLKVKSIKNDPNYAKLAL